MVCPGLPQANEPIIAIALPWRTSSVLHFVLQAKQHKFFEHENSYATYVVNIYWVCPMVRVLLRKNEPS